MSVQDSGLGELGLQLQVRLRESTRSLATGFPLDVIQVRVLITPSLAPCKWLASSGGGSRFIGKP